MIIRFSALYYIVSIMWWCGTLHYFVTQLYIVEGQLEIGMVKEGSKLFCLPKQIQTGQKHTMFHVQCHKLQHRKNTISNLCTKCLFQDPGPIYIWWQKCVSVLINLHAWWAPWHTEKEPYATTHWCPPYNLNITQSKRKSSAYNLIPLPPCMHESGNEASNITAWFPCRLSPHVNEKCTASDRALGQGLGTRLLWYLTAQN